MWSRKYSGEKLNDIIERDGCIKEDRSQLYANLNPDGIITALEITRVDDDNNNEVFGVKVRFNPSLKNQYDAFKSALNAIAKGTDYFIFDNETLIQPDTLEHPFNQFLNHTTNIVYTDKMYLVQFDSYNKNNLAVFVDLVDGVDTLSPEIHAEIFALLKLSQEKPLAASTNAASMFGKTKLHETDKELASDQEETNTTTLKN